MSRRVSTDRRVVIIGAGVGGLATGALLAKAGYNVTIYESRHQAGGRAGVKNANGFKYDTGPSWYLMPEVYEHFFGLLGERVEDHLRLHKLEPAYKVFYDYRQPLTITGDITEDSATFEAIEPGSSAALAKYLQNSERTYELAKQHFLYNPFTDYRTLATPAVLRHSGQLLRLLGQSLDAYVGNHFRNIALRQIMEYPAVFLGASPFDAPAMYHLMSYLDFKQGVYYPQGGMYEIVRALETIAKQSGVTVQLSSPVSTILTDGGRASGIQLADGREINADIVISNADLHHTETQLVPEASRSYPEPYWRKKTAGPSALLLYLGVKGSLPMLEHHNLLFTEKWQQNFQAIFDTKTWPEHPSLYVCRPSATDPSVAPAGTENLFVLVPLPAGTFQAADKTDAYADMCLQLIAEHCKIPDLQSRIIYRDSYDGSDFARDLHAWQGTALGLSHVLRQSAFFRPSNRSKKLLNLYYVGGDTQPGVGLPMCLISAQIVYKLLHNDRSAGPPDSLATTKEDH